MTVAIAPPSGIANQDRSRVGAIFGADGKVRQHLYVDGSASMLAESIRHGLQDAGLKTVTLSAVPQDHKPGVGAKYLIVPSPVSMQVNKRFGSRTTVHGRYFKMHSEVKLLVELFDSNGHRLFSGSITGSEDEPPAPVGKEEFLPLETDPAESLSVAISRAVGAIIIEPGIRRILPGRASS